MKYNTRKCFRISIKNQKNIFWTFAKNNNNLSFQAENPIMNPHTSSLPIIYHPVSLSVSSNSQNFPRPTVLQSCPMATDFPWYYKLYMYNLISFQAVFRTIYNKILHNKIAKPEQVYLFCHFNYYSKIRVDPCPKKIPYLRPIKISTFDTYIIIIRLKM